MSNIKQNKAKSEIKELHKMNEEQMKIALEFSNAGVWEWDLKSNLVTWSEENYRLLGYEPHSFSPTFDHWIERVHPDDRPSVLKKVNTAVETTSSLDIEFRILLPDGKIKWIHDRGKFTFNKKMQPKKMFGIQIDITEKKENEQKNLMSHQIIKDIIDNSPSLIYMFDTNGNFIMGNNNFEKIINIPLTEIVGKKREEFLSHEFCDQHRKNDLIVLNTKQSIIIEEENREASGIQFYLTVKFPIFDVNGKVWAIGGISTNITAHKKVEMALQESDELLRLSSELANVAAWEYNFETNSMSRSKNHDALYGLPIQPEWEFDTFTNATHPDDRENSTNIIQQSVAKDGPNEYKFDFRVIYPDKSIHWLNVIGKVIKRNNEGNGILVRGFLIDITDYKKALIELKESENRFKAFMNNTSSLTWIKDEQLNYVFLNKAYENRLNIQLEQIIGKNDYTIFDAQTAELLQNNDRKVLDKMQLIETEEIVNDADGDVFHALVNKFPIVTQSGKSLIGGIAIDISKQKNAEYNLIKTEKLYRELFENMTAGFVLFETVLDENKVPVDLIILAANKGFEKTTGLKLIDSIGKRLTTVLPGIENDSADWIGKYSHVALTGVPIHFEQGSELLEVYYSVNAYQSSDKKCAVTFDDITQRKKAEKELIESESHFRQLFENNPQPMWIYDVETLSFLDVNQTAVKKYGYTKDEFLAMNLKDIRPANEIPSLIQNLKTSTDEFQQSEVWQHQLKDGSIILVEIISHQLQFNGKLARLVLAHDVTKRKQAEEELLIINHELKSLNETILASAKSSNLKEILDLVLNKCLQIVGLEAGTVCLVEPDNSLKLISQINTSDSILKDFEEKNIQIGDCLCGNCAIDKYPLILYNRQEVLQYSIREVLRNEEIYFHAAFPFISKENCIGVLCVFTRTDKKPTERSLKLLETITSQIAIAIENSLLVQGLENKVQERTQKLLELNKELETFSYSVSHDLKAPLRGIDGYSNLLQELYANELNPEAKTFINNIRSGTLQMNQIIDDLLMYSRIDRTLIKKNTINLYLFINNIIEMYHKELNDFHFEINNKIPNTSIIADLDGLSIAFRNIFENAIKFSKFVENPKIKIELIENHNVWQLLVIDNGIGFDMKYYDKVFQIFQRLHRVEDYPGTGIGLAMVQKAMNRMGGNVSATGELGKGATFILEIPKI